MKTRKEIQLPSGAVAVIRPLSMLDVATIGQPPASLARRKPEDPLTEKELAWHVAHNRTVLARCVGTIRWQNPPRSARIVDKPFDECREDEITVEDLPDADAVAILDAVAGLRKEAADAVRTFPAARPEAGAVGGPHGAEVSPAAG